VQSITTIIALIVSVLVLLLQPVAALVAYTGVLLWYPSYLRVSLGTIDISAGRIVVAVLLLRCLFDDRLAGRFRWSRMDTWVTGSVAVYVITYVLAHPFEMALENRGGFVMDTWLSYMAFRLVIMDRTTLVSFLKWTGILLAPLAILGMVESVTLWSPWSGLMRFVPWELPEALKQERELRWGLARAGGSFSHAIMFGASFALFFPLVWSLRRQKDSRRVLAYVVSAALLLGAFSSMSSGSWLMLGVAIGCLIMERYRGWVKPLLVTFLAGCVFVEVASDRHFYAPLLSLFSSLGGDFYHRILIMDLAIEHFGEWWLLGYGGKNPGWFGVNQFTDVTNEFVLAGVQYGILGVLALCGVLVTAFRSLMQAYRRTADGQLRAIYWGLGSTLCGVIAVWISVSFFGQMSALFYGMLGIIGSAVQFSPESQRVVSVKRVVAREAKHAHLAEHGV